MEVAVAYFRAGYDPRHQIQLKRYAIAYESNLIHCFHVAVIFLIKGCCEPSHVVEKGRLKLHIICLYFGTFDCIGKAIDTREFNHC